MNANLRNFALWVIIVLLLLALFTLFQNPGQRTTSQDISFSQLLNEVDQGRVRDVLIQGPEIHGTFTDGRTFQTYSPSDPTLIQRPEQGEAVARSLGDGVAVILRGHGAVIVGASIEQAFAASVMLEDNALRAYRASQIGTPRPLQGRELEEAKAQIWHPKVAAKMWHFYLMKAKANGVLQV